MPMTIIMMRRRRMRRQIMVMMIMTHMIGMVVKMRISFPSWDLANGELSKLVNGELSKLAGQQW